MITPSDIRPHQVANYLKDVKRMGCTCDLDNWEPTVVTGHSWVCRIHKAAMEANLELRTDVVEYLNNQ